MESWRREPIWAWTAVLVGGALIGLGSARPFAGGWNDGSRLATVESLVDRRTWVIDDSIFVKAPVTPSPYLASDRGLHEHGTQDKLFINGHFYSDKSPVPALLMAGVYQCWRWLNGAAAVECPETFCRLMTACTSGCAYLTMVGCLFACGGVIGLPLATRLFLTICFGIGTTALPYAQHVNNHLLLVAAAAMLFMVLLRAGRDGWTNGRALAAGTALGVAYVIDLAAGPMLVLAVGGLALGERVGRRNVVVALTAAMPWLIVHHAINFAISGGFGPANAVPEYLAWPDSPFSTATMTGHLAHSSCIKAFFYALEMLFGKKGFFSHNLILFVALLGFPRLFRIRCSDRAVVLAGLAWSVGTWLLYALTSTNQSGACCSIRWLVPLLVPGFITVAVLLREFPDLQIDAAIFGGFGIILGLCMAYCGPWYMRIIPGFWACYASSITFWASSRGWLWLRQKTSEMRVTEHIGVATTG